MAHFFIATLAHFLLAICRNEAEMARYREEHPWKERLHDFHVMPDKELTAKQEAEASLKAERAKLQKALEKSQRENMKAVHALDEAKHKAMPEALRTHERRTEYFRDVEGIYQPMKEKEIAKQQELRREQELARQQEREKERQQGRERGQDSGRYMGR